MSSPKTRSNGEGSVFWSAATQRWIASCTQTASRNSSAPSSSVRQSPSAQPGSVCAAKACGQRRIADWLDEQKPRYDDRTGDKIAGVEPTTWANYERDIRKYIKPYLGAKKFSLSRTTIITRMLNMLVLLVTLAVARRRIS